MGLGWDPVKPSGFFSKLLNSDTAIDLDASCILLDSARQPLDLVWFRQLKSTDGSIVHSGDNRTGEGDGDDEVDCWSTLNSCRRASGIWCSPLTRSPGKTSRL